MIRTNALVLRGRGSEETFSPPGCCTHATFVRGTNHLREQVRYPPRVISAHDPCRGASDTETDAVDIAARSALASRSITKT
eukprot:4022898-Pleurochrysis_carterae.AAC.3